MSSAVDFLLKELSITLSLVTAESDFPIERLSYYLCMKNWFTASAIVHMGLCICLHFRHKKKDPITIWLFLLFSLSLYLKKLKMYLWKVSIGYSESVRTQKCYDFLNVIIL